MNFEDERYVRLFTRDTPNMIRMTWEARAVLPWIMRKLDRSGSIDLGASGAEGLEALAELIRMPVTIVTAGVTDLIKRKTLAIRGVTIIMPNFSMAQEIPKTDAERARAYRDRKKAKRLEESDSSDQFTNPQVGLPIVTNVTRVTNTVTPILTDPILPVTNPAAASSRLDSLPARAREEQEPRQTETNGATRYTTHEDQITHAANVQQRRRSELGLTAAPSERQQHDFEIPFPGEKKS